MTHVAQADLFDRTARRLARQRALRLADPFLLAGAFDELLERLAAIDRPKDQLLLVGALDPSWAGRLGEHGAEVTLLEPAMGSDEDRTPLPAAAFDAAIACGSLDTINDLPLALGVLARALRPDAPLLAVCFGGNSLATLRRALIAADRPAEAVSPRAHPRLDPSSLNALLGNAGLVAPVIDIERLRLRYPSLDRLVADLRAIGATNQLAARSRANPGRAWRSRLEQEFMQGAIDGKVTETLELLHVLAWSAPARA